jgi:low affinity Fe/Cu permease
MPRKPGLLERFARRATMWTGSSAAFALAAGSIFVWLFTYPLFVRWSETPFDSWQLVINTGTTIITFLMVFLIQRAQNKDSQAIHLKLNELVAAIEGASSRLINVEDLSEQEVQTLHKYYCRLYELARSDEDLTKSHSVEEAAGRHKVKSRRRMTA